MEEFFTLDMSLPAMFVLNVSFLGEEGEGNCNGYDYLLTGLCVVQFCL